MKKLLSLFFVFLLTGCGIGSIVAFPLKTTGAAVNVVAPKAVGNTITGVGEIAEDTIPF